MRHGARLLYVLLCAQVTAIAAVTSAPIAHAQQTSAPKPYVIVIDPGHGGSPNNQHPDQQFDPGAIGTNGLLEKDVTLDISRRLQTLLQAQRIEVIMTRNSDTFSSIPDRSAIATNANADLFVSIHLNSFTDASATGSLVLYPSDKSVTFARKVADSVGTAISKYKVANNGVQLRDDWWIHLNMPVCTVESAYLSNPQEAHLLTTSAFRQSVAQGIADGIYAYNPDIRSRGAAIIAAEKTSAQSQTAPPAAPPSQGFSMGKFLLLLAMVVAGIRYRVWLFAQGQRLYGFAYARTHVGSRRLAARRRRELVRQRSETYRSLEGRRVRSSIYDELHL